MRSSIVLGLITLLSAAAVGQTTGPLQGKWTGTAKGQGGGELEVELVIAEATGTWRFVRAGNRGRKGPCLDKEFPIVVLSQSATNLSIKVNGDKVMQGCMEQTVTLTSTDGKSLQGDLDDGRPVALTRK